MRAFAALIDSVSDTSRPEAKQRLIARYLEHASDPDRGWALAALAGVLDLPRLKPKMLRAMVEDRLDPVLFSLSYDYVRDLAETVSLVWQVDHGANRAPGLGEIIEAVRESPRADLPDLVCRWLGGLDPAGRYALLRLLGGGVRAGVSPRQVRGALALFADKDLSEIEARWHGSVPPYKALLAWVEGRAPPPPVSDTEVFRPFMTARAIGDAAIAKLDAGDYWAEWQWKGSRAQLVVGQAGAKLYSAEAEDISARFPEIIKGLTKAGVVDGVLLRRADEPALFRAHDMLVDGAQDIRALPLAVRRERLARWLEGAPIDLSPIAAFENPGDLEGLHARARAMDVGGIILKRRSSAYVAGCLGDHWLLWARAPLTADCVLLYVDREKGGEATFGCWRGRGEAAELVPVGKVMLDEAKAIGAAVVAWAQDNIVDRFGPVAAVSPDLVVEIAFDTLRASTRHKAGFVMTGARLSRLQKKAPPEKAARVETLARMLS